MTMPKNEPDPLTTPYDSGKKESEKRELARMAKARAGIGNRPDDYDPLEDPAFDKIGGYGNAMKVIVDKIAETAKGLETESQDGTIASVVGDHETLKTECTFKKGTMPDWVVEAFRISYVYCLKRQGKAVPDAIKTRMPCQETAVRSDAGPNTVAFGGQPKENARLDANVTREDVDRGAVWFDDDGDPHGHPEDD